MIGVLGGGAFGTALAMALAQDGRLVRLWARDAGRLQRDRENKRYLPGLRFPDSLEVCTDMHDLCGVDAVLAAVPMQSLALVLSEHCTHLNGTPLIACCKGIDRQSLTGASQLILRSCPRSAPGVLTGPSFASDIARGLPTALTFAYAGSDAVGLQAQLSTRSLRLYLTDDLIGAELGGALKNVVAIACGAAMGAKLGESARAALMTRGYAEMARLAGALGGRPETLAGLSGFGDLALTCTSTTSRNYAHGFALGAGTAIDPKTTVEGVHTAQAVATLARDRGLDVPITRVVADLVAGHTSVQDAMGVLLARPLKEE